MKQTISPLHSRCPNGASGVLKHDTRHLRTRSKPPDTASLTTKYLKEGGKRDASIDEAYIGYEESGLCRHLPPDPSLYVKMLLPRIIPHLDDWLISLFFEDQPYVGFGHVQGDRLAFRPRRHSRLDIQFLVRLLPERIHPTEADHLDCHMYVQPTSVEPKHEQHTVQRENSPTKGLVSERHSEDC